MQSIYEMYVAEVTEAPAATYATEAPADAVMTGKVCRDAEEDKEMNHCKMGKPLDRSRSTMDSSFDYDATQSLGSSGASSLSSHHADFNLVLGMERTLFAALNNSWLLALGGIGLMSVGSGDQRATESGIFILIGGIVSAFAAIMMHFIRLYQIRNNRPCQHKQTILWSSIIAIMTIITFGLELYFGMLYPYLDREKAVTIAD